MSKLKVAASYSLFAAISIGINLVTQVLVVEHYGGSYRVSISILAGTATGLIAKYVLDKKYIFEHRSKGTAHEARTFGLYTLMGLATTVLFWGTEATFQLIFATDAMRYLGGFLGLCTGYFIKYRLDKKFVFVGER